MTAICRRPKYNGNPYFRLHWDTIRMKGRCTMAQRKNEMTVIRNHFLIWICLIIVTLVLRRMEVISGSVGMMMALVIVVYALLIVANLSE